MIENGPVRTRFAPSPTGLMHIGGLRTALYSWLLARSTGGQFVLRIEDTDRKRYDERAVEHIKESLHWLGLDWDEGPDIGGPHAPYFQSERLQVYQEAVDRLVTSGAAYYDDTQPDELAALRQRQRAAGQAPGYDNRGRHRTLEQIEDSRSKGLDINVRLRVPEHGTLECEDLNRGTLKFDLGLLRDFVILKSDGYPTYHLAHIVDDHAMGITHVVRAEEWIPSVPRHVLLHDALSIPKPSYVHLPLILGSDRSKLSKRHGAQSALEYRDLGYLPDAVLNYLALLGWSPGDDTQLMSRCEIVRRFAVERVLKHPASFDPAKIESMNFQHIQQLSDREFTDYVMPILNARCKDGGLPDSVERPVDDEVILRLASVLKERIRTANEVTALVDFFYVDADAPKPEDMIGRRMDAEMVVTALNESRDLLVGIAPFDATTIDSELRQLATKTEMKAGQLFTPIRIAVTGRRVAPPLFETLEVLGRETTLQRLERALDIMGAFGKS